MASVNAHKGKLYFDIRYRGRRCKEYTSLADTPANRRRMEAARKKIDAAITLDQFDYREHFPNSSNAAQFDEPRGPAGRTETPLFRDYFAQSWMPRKEAESRTSHSRTLKGTFDKHLLEEFGCEQVGQITKARILQFRAKVLLLPGRKGDRITTARANKIIGPLLQLLNDAAEEFDFPSPCVGIKSLRVPRTDIFPFPMDDVQLILQHVRSDFEPYYTTRFFTGLRTAEIDGLKWQYVDFDNRQILVREAHVLGETVPTKNDGSFRNVHMPQLVYDALRRQHVATHQHEYVFCTRNGTPFQHRNITNRVWYPLLRHLGLQKRTPYQTRHTYASMMLAAGESPEFVARQMGHSTTEMLFRIYSRYVPNLTRQDGSAVERLLASHFQTNQHKDEQK